MLNVPDVRQKFGWDCGAAVVTAVLRFHRKRASLAGVRSDLLSEPHQGTHPSAIESYLRRRGLFTLSGSMTIPDLAFHTRQGRPVILAVRDHYIVCTAARRGRVYFNCPEDGRQFSTVVELLNRWLDHTCRGEHFDRYGIACER